MTARGAKRHNAKGRDSGRWKQPSIPGPFTWRLIEMLQSPAHRELSLSARKVLDRIEIEKHHHGGGDNGKLPITYQDLEDYGIQRAAIAPAIREAEALGFIEITDRGRAGNGGYRKANRFRLTYHPTDGYPATDEWKRITTAGMAADVARKARKASKKKKSPVSENEVKAVSENEV